MLLIVNTQSRLQSQSLEMSQILTTIQSESGIRVMLVVLRFPIKIQTRIRIKIGNPSVPRRGSHAMLTHGWGCPTNHPQFRAINCCQLWIGSCRPDLCRILGAFLHFPDNPNCGSLVICGGGEPPPCAMCTIAGTGVTKVGQGKDKGRENTQQQKIWSSPLFVKRLSIPNKGHLSVKNFPIFQLFNGRLPHFRHSHPIIDLATIMKTHGA